MQAFICDAIRTPIGRYGGTLSSIRTDDLAAIPIAALVARNPDLAPNCVDEVILGCVNQAGEDNRNVARMANLLAGLPEEVPGVTVNRLCASGAEAVGTAARAIIAGELDVVIAGGVESMSRSPFVVGKAASAFARSTTMEDTTIGWRFVNPRMQQTFGVDPMPSTAENVAEKYAVSRQDQDLFALSSQRRAAAASKAGYFAQEIVPVTVLGPRGSTQQIDTDEHPRPDTSIELLSGLKPVVRQDGTITAGNASGVNDGAAAMIVASEAGASRHQLVPRARILGMASAGVAPRVMGIGPVPATRKLLDRLNLAIDDFDVIEINEAFASQVIACLRALGADPMSPHVNPNGGAIALGHPLGASGARLVITAVHALQKTGGRRALVTMCIGVGQGLALALERI